MTGRSALLKSLLLSCALAGGCECLPASQIACNITTRSMCPDNYFCNSVDGPGFCQPSAPDAGGQTLDAGTDGGNTLDGGSDGGSLLDGGLDAGPTEDAGTDGGLALDAGTDAGLENDGGTDAGLVSDAGTDAGVVSDAGLDAGMDAGIVVLTDAGPSSDGGADAGPVDAGTLDAGSGDAGSQDAGTADAGFLDAGPIDAGLSDAGPTDAGTPDAGSMTTDAGSPPPAPNTGDGGVVYTRVPWGVDGGAPSFTVTGGPLTAAGDPYIAAYDSQGGLISPVTQVAGDGSFSLTLSGGDHTLVYLAGLSADMSQMSAMAQVHDVVWTATFGGKIAGDLTHNPHILYEATDFLISGEGLGTPPDAGSAVLVQQGPLTQDPNFTTEATVATGGYAGVKAADGTATGFDSQSGVWYDRTPGASVAVPSIVQSAMAYDAARGRTVLFGGSVQSDVTNRTYEWDGNNWSDVTPATGRVPAGRIAHAMAYDAACGCTLLFGGKGSAALPLNDTWEWDGAQWTLVPSASTPSGRFGHTMAYDSVRGVMVMFGGFDSLGNPDAETWEWSSGQWTMRTPATSPPARCFAGMDFDSFRGKTVLYGGELCTGNMSNTTPDTDLWEWDGNSWNNPQPSGGPPSGLYAHGMAFSTQHMKSVIFGGDSMADVVSGTTWTWDGTSWGTVATPGPSARAWNSMAYDSSRDQVLTFGGRDGSSNPQDDTWAWTQTSSSPTVTTTWVNATPGTASQIPTARQNHALAFDSTNDVTVLFGGNDASGLRNDTWLWNGYSWSNPDPQTIPNARQGHAMAYQGSGITLMVGGDEASGLVNDTWEWNGTNWGQQMPIAIAEAPSVQEAAVAYDSAHGEAVLFGGSNSATGSSGPQAETYLWNGSGWTDELLLASAPTARYWPAMTYDSNHGYALLFGGFGTLWNTDTWEWSGTAWTNTMVTGPTLGGAAAMVFDANRQEPLLFGGPSSPETWVWTGTAWAQVKTATSPPGRSGFAMAYDSNRRTTVLVGGESGTTLLNDTWELPTQNNTRAAAIAEFSFGAADTQLNAVIQQMTFTAIIGGSGNGFSVNPPGNRAQGATLAVWDATGGGWKELGADLVSVPPSAVSYTTASAAEAQGYVLPEPDTINLAMFSSVALSNADNHPSTVLVDYVQVTVRYVQP